MKVKKASVPVFNLQLSNLEASAALYACGVVEEQLTDKRLASTPYRKAALAFSKSLKKALLAQGVQSDLDEVAEMYPTSSPGKRSLPPSRKIPEKNSPSSEGKGEGENFEEQISSLIASDEALLQAE